MVLVFLSLVMVIKGGNNSCVSLPGDGHRGGSSGHSRTCEHDPLKLLTLEMLAVGIWCFVFLL